MPMAVTGLSN